MTEAESTTKRIVCLANSRKLNGRCVAGRELVDGDPAGWIRPVSDRPHQEVSEEERQYADGSDPGVLDVIDVPMLRSAPYLFQKENWLVDPDKYWVKVGRLGWDDLEALADPDGPLWIDGHSTYNGHNDKVPLTLTEAIDTSLRLVHVENVDIKVFVPGRMFGNTKRRVQARFELAGRHEYAVWVTDPIYERRFKAEADGSHSLGESYLTMSLGEPYEGDTYKLVATIIERNAMMGSGPS